jgi:hypothetical protein
MTITAYLGSKFWLYRVRSGAADLDLEVIV